MYNQYGVGGGPGAPPPPPPPPPLYQGHVPQGVPASAIRGGAGGMPYNPNSPMPRISVLSKCPACGYQGYTSV